MANIYKKYEDFTNSTLTYNVKEEEEVIREDDRDKNYMNKSNIIEILEHAEGIKKMLENDFSLDEWAKDHISRAADDLAEVYHYIQSVNDK
jgi:hypothetical protein